MQGIIQRMLLQDHVALITGAGAGIGEAIARLFAEEGARVFLLDRDAVSGHAVAESIRAAGGCAAPFTADVRHRQEIATAVQAAVDQFGRIDVLVNNAGIFPRQPFLEMTSAQWDEMQDVNLKSMFHTGQLVLPHMIARRSGTIVNISSVTFHLGMSNMAHYVSSKGGVIGLTRALAREAGGHGIRVNCITPGAIRTESEARFVTPEEAQAFMASQCLQRRLTPLDVARVCLFLSCELSSGMTGQCLNVDGGWVMY